jgi:hypothetical protein
MENKKDGKETELTPAKQERQVLTLYFNVELVDNIDDFLHLARKKIPVYKRRKLSRTTLIGLILQEVMDDYAQFQSDSFLYKLLLTSKDNQT